MNVINGLPAHILLVHFVVVLVPMTALLEITCGLWPAARRRFVWLALALATAVGGITALTTRAGQWFYDRESPHSAVLDRHADLGSSMAYVAAALLAVAVLLAVMYMVEVRSAQGAVPVRVAVAIVAVVVGVASTIQVYRIGDSGARAAWGDALTKVDKP